MHSFIFVFKGHALAKGPPGQKIKSFGRSFLDHYHYTLKFSELCLGVEKIRAFSLSDLMVHTLAQEPLPGVHEIYNFVRSLL